MNATKVHVVSRNVVEALTGERLSRRDTYQMAIPADVRVCWYPASTNMDAYWMVYGIGNDQPYQPIEIMVVDKEER